ncbi:hypothetical protein TREMEDRAFT_27203, partial [Tremella mesenterica DSM 1558]|uniref:uncharacterized protein n=1 Tax=Tremella mesenterica (strain ATCC 24925 / CBS 8224 / DSM 1558 / NBRC 9311 / NRRL Y-6157 / RJB 2259-6 / UBC 559-6) TaxID=578456 RepID=UPI0003F49506
KRKHRPSRQVQQVLGQGNIAYIDGRHDDAIRLFLEVIRHDPHVFSAWTSLASCYDELGDEEAARQMRFFAAHVENEAETWRELAAQFKERDQIPQCLYCLRKALQVDPDDVGSLWEISALYREQNKISKAVEAFKKILKTHSPTTYNFDLLMEFFPLFTETTHHDIGAQAFRRAFEWHYDHFNGPEEVYSDLANTMRLEHVIAVGDLLMLGDQLEEALLVIRRGQRWLQNRKDERQFDALDDDREYDPPGVQRLTESGEQAEDLGTHPLDVNLRQRLALLRLRLGDDDEAMLHVDHILEWDVELNQTLFMELGEALLKREMWEKALEVLAELQSNDNIPDSPALIYALGQCYYRLQDHAAAEEALRWVLRGRITRGEVRTGRGPSKGDRSAEGMFTRRMLEEEMHSLMQSLWKDVQAAEEGIANGEVGALDKFVYAAETMVENFRVARNNFGKNRGVVRVRKYPKQRKNDLTTQAQELQERLEREMGREFITYSSAYVILRSTDLYGLGYEEWLALVIKYCCVLMVKSEEEFALDILEHVVWSGVFNNRRCEIALRLTTVAAAMRAKAYDKIYDNCKRLAQLHQFRIEPLQLMLACLGGKGLRAAVVWQGSILQRFVHRELRIWDDAAHGLRLHYNPIWGRWAQSVKNGYSRLQWQDVDNVEEVEVEEEEGGGERNEDIEMEEELVEVEKDQEEMDLEFDGEGLLGNEQPQEEVPRPTKPSPGLNVLYGQHMLSAKSYQSALYYFMRAYQVDQYNPFICLLIAQAFFGRSMNRQSDNRNFQMAQGLAFLTKYRELSLKDPISQEEVEYNFGRAFHGIGIPHLAIVHYERVLDSIKKRMEQSDDPEGIRKDSFAMESAHNLMLLYTSSGNIKLVKDKSIWMAI